MSDTTTATEKQLEALREVYQHFLKNSRRNMARTADYHLPFLFDKRKRNRFFDEQYIPFIQALMIESIRNATASLYGKASNELIEKMTTQIVTEEQLCTFQTFIDVINREVEKNPPEPRPIIEALTTAFLTALYSEASDYPVPELISSPRHQVAVNFAVGTYLYKMQKAVKTKLSSLNDQTITVQPS